MIPQDGRDAGEDGDRRVIDESAFTHARRRVGGIELHVVEAGPEDGPLAILLHGFPEFWYGLRHQIDALAKAGFRVVAPDMRGYNLSERPRETRAYSLSVLVADVVALAWQYGRTSFRLLGHDWGGVVAWQVAIEFPKRVERLVVVNAPQVGVWHRVAFRNLRQLVKSYYVGVFQVPGLPERLFAAHDFAVAKGMLTLTSREGTFSDDDLARYVEAWSKPHAFTAMIDYYRALKLQTHDNSRVEPPTLIVWGAKDAFLELAVARANRDLCDDGRLMVVEDATHWVLLEEPERTSAAIVEFFAQGISQGVPKVTETALGGRGSQR